MCEPPRPFAPLALITLASLMFNALKWAEFKWRWINVDEFGFEVEQTDKDKWILIHEPSALALDSLYRQIVG